MSDSESEPLLRSRSGQAGVINDANQTEAESNPASITTQTSSTNQGSCVSCCNRLRSEPDQCRLLVINLLVLVFACLTAGLMLVELSMAYGQCIIGMPLYEGGLLTQNVEKFWCRCPLYTVMLTSTVAWISIMINWVSDLRTKKCAFAKWTKWQFILTLGGSIFTFSAFIVSIWGFGKWCERVKHSDDGGDNVYVSSSSKSSQMCFDAAVSFDNRFTNHDEQFVKLVHTFWYSIGITILEGLLTIWWFGANWLSFRLWSKGSRELFYANYDILTRNDANDRSLRRGRNTNEATTNEADNGNDGDNEGNTEPVHSN